ncbi:hypothetical protein B0O99DRAFT_222582 [Bisporella sp. PMI_857]|nr:hypothetical protein B0O99DRAFT_222582 [Bisporella sp. PMI_857]
MQDQHMPMRRHGNTKKCSFCDRTFTKQEHLRRHQRTHTGERPFGCPKCSRRYGRSDVLARHIQTHRLENHENARRSTILNSNPVDISSEPQSQDSGNNFNQHDSNSFILPDSQRFSPNQEQQFNLSPPGAASTGHDRRPSDHSDLLPSISNSLPVASIPQTQSRQGQPLAGLDTCPGMHSTSSSMQSNVRHNELNDITQQDLSISSLIPRGDTGGVPNLQNATQEGEFHVAADGSFRNHTTESFAFQPTTQDQERLKSLSREGGAHQSTPAQFRPLLDPQLSSVFPQTGGGNFDTDIFRMETDFNPYGYFSPGMLDGLDLGTPGVPLSTSPLHKDKNGSNQTFLSDEQTQQVRNLWRGRRSAPGVRIIWSLWGKVAQHGVDNIFSQSRSAIPSPPEAMTEGTKASKWGMNEDCRKDLIAFCKDLDDRAYRERTTELESISTPPQTQSEHEMERSIPVLSADGFLTREVLDASLDFFFQYFPMPFIHKATFDASTTPTSLLFPMCLVGLALLYPEGSKPFVLRYQKSLIQFCHDNLASRALGHCESWELLMAIASALLVVYLGLGFSACVDVEDYQVHMLSVQMLHISEKHGLFAAYLGDDLALQLQIAPSDHESSWKIWARAESIKRLTHFLLWIDAACTRIMGSGGALDMSKVELHLTCDAALFEAPTFSRFLQAAKRGMPLIQPRLRVQTFPATAPPTLDLSSMQSIVGIIYLQIAAALLELPSGKDTLWRSVSCSPAETLARDPMNENIFKAILLIPSKYADIFRGKDTLIMMAWNNLGMVLSADLDLLEIASGREGLEPARAAMVAVTKWSRSSSARRAVLHASQVFRILSSSRPRISNIARLDRLIFVSAIVLCMYLFVVEQREEDQNSQVFELLQDIDWATIGGEGLHYPPENGLSTLNLACQSPQASNNAVLDFLRHSGPVTFAGEDQLGGASTARKIMLNYVHLLDDLGKWRSSRFAQSLRIMSDLGIEGGQ